ncbi:MAG: CpsD/CapB family tyrosine-protein kinase [Marinosulfonomonas sp.]|nr:CpsD/CapB family tyrosine-protein kinase [Marinosulfonomonas sp.]
MERLEAALDKARHSRESIQTDKKSDAVRPLSAAGTTELWQQLKEFKISSRAARSNRITTLTNNKLSSPYDLLRSRVLRLMRENKWHTLAITSPNVACGKTTVCANLAISLSRQPDTRVLVIDLDLRRPSLHRILSYRPNHSFHEVLEGKVQAEDQLVRFGDNLAFGLNNKPARNPSELLQSKQCQTKLAQVQAAFKPDIVIFDLPPMMVGDDNVAFLPTVDAGLLVSAADSTTVAQVDTCEKEMAEMTNPLGVVLNKCRYFQEDSSYGNDFY